MPQAAAVVSVENTRRHKKIRYAITFSGNYNQSTATEALDLTIATNPKNLAGAFPGNRVPTSGVLLGNPGGNPGEVEIGLTNKLHHINLYSSINTELANGAYNAATTGDANVYAEFTWDAGV